MISVRELSGRLRNLDALCRELGIRPLTDRRSAEEERKLICVTLSARSPFTIMRRRLEGSSALRA